MTEKSDSQNDAIGKLNDGEGKLRSQTCLIKIGQMRQVITSIVDSAFHGMSANILKCDAEPDVMTILKRKIAEIINPAECFNSDGDVGPDCLTKKLIASFSLSRKIIFNNSRLEVMEKKSGDEYLRKRLLAAVQLALTDIARINGAKDLFNDWLACNGIVPVSSRFDTLPGMLRPSQRITAPIDPSRDAVKPASSVNEELNLENEMGKMGKDTDGQPTGPAAQKPPAEPEPVNVQRTPSILPPAPVNEGEKVDVVFSDENERNAKKQFRGMFIDIFEHNFHGELEKCEGNIEHTLHLLGEIAHANLFMMDNINPECNADYRYYFRRKRAAGVMPEKIILDLAMAVAQEKAYGVLHNSLPRMVDRIVMSEVNRKVIETLPEDQMEEETKRWTVRIYNSLKRSLPKLQSGNSSCWLMYFLVENQPQLADALMKEIFDLLDPWFKMYREDVPEPTAEKKIEEQVEKEIAQIITAHPILPVGMDIPIQPLESEAAAEPKVGEIPEITLQVEEGESLASLFSDDEPDTSTVQAATFTPPKKAPEEPKKPGVIVAPTEPTTALNVPHEEIIIRYDDDNEISPDCELHIVDGQGISVPIIRPAAGAKPEPVAKGAVSSDPNVFALNLPEEPSTMSPQIKVIAEKTAETVRPQALKTQKEERVKPALSDATKEKIRGWVNGFIKGVVIALKVTAAASVITLAASAAQNVRCSSDSTDGQQASVSTTGLDGGASDTGVDVKDKSGEQRTAQTPPAEKKHDVPSAAAAQSKMGVKMKVNSAKMPSDQVLARRFLESGKYPEGMDKRDHLSKLLFIFGQNLTNAESVQINRLIAEYNIGEYAHNLNEFKGKGPKNINEIGSSIQGQARKELTHALLYNSASYRENFVKKHLAEMALYDQCNSEFSKAGRYGNNGTVDGNLTTFTARLMMIRGWGTAITESPANTGGAAQAGSMTGGSGAPGVNASAPLPNLPPLDSVPAVDLELPDYPDAGERGMLDEIDRGWDDITVPEMKAGDGKDDEETVLTEADFIDDEETVLTEADIIEEKDNAPNNAATPIKANPLTMTKKEMDEIDSGWDIEEKNDEGNILTEADIIKEETPEQIAILTRDDILEEIEVLTENDLIIDEA